MAQLLDWLQIVIVIAVILLLVRPLGCVGAIGYAMIAS